jgi:hypothetical protein
MRENRLAIAPRKNRSTASPGEGKQYRVQSPLVGLRKPADEGERLDELVVL